MILLHTMTTAAPLPRIVVLDGYTLNPGDLVWSSLERLGTCVIHPRTAAELVVPRSRDAEILLTNKTPLSASTLAQLPALRAIAVLATGYNVVDVAAARARGITVMNVPAYSTPSVAQHVLALLLELTQHTGLHNEAVRSGRWADSPDFCFWETPLIELSGLTLGIIGAGQIGKAVGRIGEALGMKVEYALRSEGRAGLERVLRQADVVSLHCPLTEATRHIINRESLAWMKPSAYLINTGRGPLVDESALADALNSGRLAGAGLDVLSNEPPAANHPLTKAQNCIITPHIAWATSAARRRLLATVVENVRLFLNGTPQNVVS